VVLAVDLGGTKTAIARVDGHGVVHRRWDLPAARTLEATIAQVAGAAAEDGGPGDAVGVIVPGIYNPTTGRAWCPNLWGREEVPLRRALEDRLGADVFIDSDRAGSVLAEAWLGAARGLGDVLFVAIGTGIGIGILSGGRVVRGAAGIAGAAGWFALTTEWKDEYSQVGCWEAEAAGPAVARHAGLPDATAVVAAARAGDPRALAALDRAARFTAMGIANLISAFDPDAVVLGGGFLVGAGDLLLDRIRAEVPRWAQPIAAARCRIELTRLGADAGLLGAARLALEHT
jgi:glucokinase